MKLQESNLATESKENDTFKIHLESALNAWSEIVGVENVDSSEESIQDYTRTCGVHSKSILGVVKPKSTIEVQEIIKAANQFKIPLYPISRGRNWGYGSATPVTDGNVILDLSRMAAILHIDEEMGYALIEPGVTQAMLSEFLLSVGSDFTIDITGGPPDASVMANILERGFGLGVYSDHFLFSCGMEVVLPLGDILETSFGHYVDAKTTHLYKWGIGPYLDGLFSQSNFGVVTKIGVWLARKPEETAALLLKIEDNISFGAFLDRWRKLKLTGSFPGQVRFANDIRMLSCFRQYPFDLFPDGRALPRAHLDRLSAEWKVSYWNGFGSFQGTKEQVEAQLKVFTREFSDIVKFEVYHDGKDNFDSAVQKTPGMVEKSSSPPQMVLDLIRGKPSKDPILGMYWRKRSVCSKGDYDPLRDRCGLFWNAPIVPMHSRDFAKVIAVTERISENFGFECNVGIVPVNDRTCCYTVATVFDKDNGDESERAERCYAELRKNYIRLGYPPYRFGVDVSSAQDDLFKSGDNFWKFCRNLKTVIDPNNILAQGRYGLNPDIHDSVVK